MRRRDLMAMAAPMVAAGCGLTGAPAVRRRDWPLRAERPTALPANPGGPVLLVRTLGAGPGMNQQGIQRIKADGSVAVGFYEQWAAPPAEAIEATLRAWLAASGLFSAVTQPGSRLIADLVVEGEVESLWSDLPRGIATAGLALIVLDQRRGAARVVGQIVVNGTAPLGDDTPADNVRSQTAALGDALRQIEADLRPLAAARDEAKSVAGP